ncbi:MAG: hypothetical protein FDZ69_07530 [Deltaproteobacteria bacterium]|nr:MAG: hypothetical protein FDZ69_07530 [Deltaproteobacteria bacterium]
MTEIHCYYFATNNRVSPFCMLIGIWPYGARMRKACVAGRFLGKRLAVQSEIDLLEKSTRHAAIYWQTLRDMLREHKLADELRPFYSGLLAAVGRNWPSIKRCQARVAEKKSAHMAERQRTAAIVAENRRRERLARDPQLNLFSAA